MPVDAVPVIANVTIQGWRAPTGSGREGKGDLLVFWVEWTSGYTEPLLVDFGSKRFTKDRWEGLELLDFAVDFGPDRLDWEFCLDDLTVGLRQCGENMCEGRGKYEKGERAKSIEWEKL